MGVFHTVMQQLKIQVMWQLKALSSIGIATMAIYTVLRSNS